MSAVDVLAVMDRDAHHADAHRAVHLLRGDVAALSAESVKARAAVAELIEAVADVYSDSCGTPCEAPCPSCRIYAALARVHPMTREQQAAETEKRA